MKKTRQVVAALLCGAMLTTCAPAPAALAAAPTTAEKTVQAENGIHLVWNDSLKLLVPQAIPESAKDIATVLSEGNTTLTSGVYTVSGEVSLILLDGCTLTAERGIQVAAGNALTISAQSTGASQGKLVAMSKDSYEYENVNQNDNAAIGGNGNQSAGTITINGGEIEATSESTTSQNFAAAIGGGDDGSGGTITINGGSVTASAKGETDNLGAGIGSGWSANTNASAGNITINGGVVKATTRATGTLGTNSGAGIGGGSHGIGGYITITGGRVSSSAESSVKKDPHSGKEYTLNYAAGIGGGNKGNVSSITISGGTVTAKADKCNANAVNSIGRGWNVEQAPTFSTSTDGHAVIIADLLDDDMSMDNTSGIFFIGDAAGVMCGDGVQPLDDWSVPAGETLTIADGQTLVIPEGVTLTIEGSLTNNGTIVNYGEIDGTVGGNQPLPATAILNASSFTYKEGLQPVPTVTVIIDGTTLTADTDYTITATNNENAGRAIATITGINRYIGTIVKPFTIDKATPQVTAPTNLTATYGQTLSNVTLPTGWAWDTPTTSVGEVGNTATFPATYTKDDSGNYNTVHENLTVKVEKATPSVTLPTSLTATYGDKLCDVELPDGWAWNDPGASVGDAGTRNFKATYTPNDTKNYKTVEKDLNVTVVKANPQVEEPTNLQATYGDKLSDVELPNGWAWNEEAEVLVGNAGTNTFKATYTPNDINNYNTVEKDLTITVGKATPQVTEPTNLTAVYGQTLNAITLPDGWTWNAPTTSVGNVGTNTFKATYTPTDTTNYNTVERTLTITVTVVETPSYQPTISDGNGGTTTVIPTQPKAGDTVVITPKPNDGYEVDKVVVTDKNGGNVEVAKKDDGTYTFTQPESQVIITVTYKEKETPADPDPTPTTPPTTPTYKPDVPESVGGTTTVTPQRPEKGDDVTITPKPEDGYDVDKVIVTDKNGNTLDVTKNDDGTYTFEQPRGKVTITVTYKEKEEPAPSTSVGDIFTDVAPDAWYTDAVQFAYDEGIMTGTSATTFSPEMTTTRAMIVAILHRLEGSPAAGGDRFADVTADAWYADAVNWAAEEGIVNGISADTFAPNDPITREQLAAILYNYAEYKGMDTSARADLSGYTDAENVSDWATAVISWANAEGLVNGMTDTTLVPQGQATRAQVAAIFERFLSK